LTAFTIWLAIRLHEVWDWRVAFGMLAIGPALGIIAMRRFQAVRDRALEVPLGDPA
jgi:hypothetical protein